MKMLHLVKVAMVSATAVLLLSPSPSAQAQRLTWPKRMWFGGNQVPGVEFFHETPEKALEYYLQQHNSACASYAAGTLGEDTSFKVTNGEPYRYTTWDKCIWSDGSSVSSWGADVAQHLVCPASSILVEFSRSFPGGREHDAYVCASQIEEPPPHCAGTTAGNPIQVETQQKVQTEVDYSSGHLRFSRYYASNLWGWRHMYATTAGNVSANMMTKASLGAAPTCRMASFKKSAGHGTYCFPYVSNADLGAVGETHDVLVQEPSGETVDFGGNGLTQSLGRDDLGQAINGAAGVYGGLYRIKHGNTLEVFDDAGRLLTEVSHAGYSRRLTYLTASGVRIPAGAPDCKYAKTGPATAGNPSCITDAVTGRQLNIEYDAMGRIVRMIDPSGGITSYSYGDSAAGQDSGALVKVKYPDNSEKGYLYDEPENNASTVHVGKLTGIVDELGKRFATFKYASDGTVVSSEHAGGVDKFSVSNSSVGKTVTDPLGTSREHSHTSILKSISTRKNVAAEVSTGISQPAGAGCNAASSAITHDRNANVVSRDDFNGNRTCYAHDLTRNLETVRVEGLSTSASCSTVTPANVSLPAGSRKISTTWHPDWRLETVRAEPGRITTSVYNGQPDPFNGGALARCAPSTALLPSGKPIAVLCKQVEQATTDSNGRLGINAVRQSGVANRVRSWNYNQHGQVLSAKGPRTDVNDTTSYAYYTDTTEDHAAGDLQTVTNALGQTARFTRNDKHGQWLQMIDSNGVVTTRTFDLRQRLLSTSVAGKTTTYAYDPAGLLKKITLPDASYVGYDYDDAHRQIAVYDNKGNRTDYVLDNAGNRIREVTKDPLGNLKRQLSRVIDPLGRVEQTTGLEAGQ